MGLLVLCRRRIRKYVWLLHPQLPVHRMCIGSFVWFSCLFVYSSGMVCEVWCNSIQRNQNQHHCNYSTLGCIQLNKFGILTHQPCCHSCCLFVQRYLCIWIKSIGSRFPILAMHTSPSFVIWKQGLFQNQNSGRFWLSNLYVSADCCLQQTDTFMWRAQGRFGKHGQYDETIIAPEQPSGAFAYIWSSINSTPLPLLVFF